MIQLRVDFALTNDTPYLALTGELWDLSWFRKKTSSRYIESAPYMINVGGKLPFSMNVCFAIEIWKQSVPWTFTGAHILYKRSQYNDFSSICHNFVVADCVACAGYVSVIWWLFNGCWFQFQYHIISRYLRLLGFRVTRKFTLPVLPGITLTQIQRNLWAFYLFSSKYSSIRQNEKSHPVTK